MKSDPCNGCNDRGICVLLRTLPICICDGAYSGRYCQHSPTVPSRSSSRQYIFKHLRDTSGVGGLLILVLLLLFGLVAAWKIRKYMGRLGSDVEVNYELHSVSWADITMLQLVSPLFIAVDRWWSSSGDYSSVQQEVSEPHADEVLFPTLSSRNRRVRRVREI